MALLDITRGGYHCMECLVPGQMSFCDLPDLVSIVGIGVALYLGHRLLGG